MKEIYSCKIISKSEIAENIFDFVVHAPSLAQSAKAGQFIHVKCGDNTFLRRPISICDVEGGNLRFIFETRGKGTETLSTLGVGDIVNTLGPLGNGFNPEICKSGAPVLVGGGIGVFPLVMLARQLGGTAKAILGFRNANKVTSQEEFTKLCSDVYISTDDGSYGKQGTVSDILETMINGGGVGAIFACGPTPMMKATAKLALNSGIPCQVSMEQRMACGVGACMCCVCPVSGENLRVCVAGPVFDAAIVEWREL